MLVYNYSIRAAIPEQKFAVKIAEITGALHLLWLDARTIAFFEITRGDRVGVRCIGAVSPFSKPIRDISDSVGETSDAR